MKKYFVMGTLISLLFVGCTNLKPSPFTANNVMQLKIGLPSNKVVKMFGQPDSIKVTTCGGRYKKPWGCTIWSYNTNNRYIDNTFYFYSYKGELYLNSWDIDKIHK